MKFDSDKPYSGKIMVLSGNVGNGKGVFGVAFARYCSKRCFHGIPLTEDCFYCAKYGYTDAQRKLIVYSNFPLNIPDVNCHFMKSIDEFLAIPNMQKLKNHKLCIFDEPNAWGFDSYSARAEVAQKIARKIQQTRHYNMDILFLTQLWSMIAPRGKRIAGESIFAVTPSNKEFQYGMYKLDEIIPISINKKYAKENIYPFYDSSHIVGEENFESEKENIGEVIDIVN